MSTTQPRRPAGIPAGGQYASQPHPKPGYHLDAEVGTDSKGDLRFPGRFDDAEAVAWRSAGISRHEATTWRLVTAYQEPPVTPEEAAEWGREMRVIQAGSWRGAGFTAASAARWSKAGLTEPLDASRWIKEGFDDPTVARTWKAEGFDAPEARSWVDAGFGTATALRWGNAGFAPSEASRVRRGGRLDPTEVDAGGW